MDRYQETVLLRAFEELFEEEQRSGEESRLLRVVRKWAGEEYQLASVTLDDRDWLRKVQSSMTLDWTDGYSDASPIVARWDPMTPEAIGARCFMTLLLHHDPRVVDRRSVKTRVNFCSVCSRPILLRKSAPLTECDRHVALQSEISGP